LRKILTILLVPGRRHRRRCYVLLGYSPVPKTSTYQLDINQIRQLAGDQTSLFPVRLNVLILGEGSMPGFIVLAGGGLQGLPTPVPVFQIVYPTGTVIVDTGMDQASFAQMFGAVPFSTQAYDRLQSAMRQSQTILLTTSTWITSAVSLVRPISMSCSPN